MSRRKINRSHDLRVQKVTKQITISDMTDSDTQQTINFDAALPSDAVVIASYVDVDEEVGTTGTATSATKACGAQTYNFAAGDTLVMDVDNIGDATSTWDAAAGTQINNDFFPVSDEDGNTVLVTIDGGSQQTVTFSGATTTSAQITTQMNAQLTGSATTEDTTAKSATKTGGTQPFVLAAGQTVIIDVDDVGDATATFDAASATITDTTSYPVADQDGLTSLITVDGGTQQTVTFSGATTTAASVSSQMNAQLTGCFVAEVGGQAKITSDVKGTDSTLAAAAGTGGLTWAAQVTGTGDVADITAVTAAEFETVVEADTTALVTVASGVITLVSPTTGVSSELDFKASTALAAFGLSIETIIGTASQPLVTSDTQGTGSTVAIVNGTASLTWSSAVAGTGDVVDIDAVTALEIETVIEADTTALVTVSGGIPTIVSPTTGATSELDFKSGNALALLTLSVEVVVGTAALNGSATIDLGISGGDTDCFLDAADVTTATGEINGPQGTANDGHYGSLTPSIIIDTTNADLDEMTEGDFTAYLWFHRITQAT